MCSSCCSQTPMSGFVRFANLSCQIHPHLLCQTMGISTLHPHTHSGRKADMSVLGFSGSNYTRLESEFQKNSGQKAFNNIRQNIVILVKAHPRLRLQKISNFHKTCLFCKNPEISQTVETFLK